MPSDMTEAVLLRLEDVSKRFAGGRRGAPPTDALRSISLTLKRGQLLGLVGPDAGGKTTLLRIIAGLVEADSGLVEVNGAAIGDLDRSKIGYLPQGGALYGELSVRHNLELYARLRGIEPEEQPDLMDRLYELTGLAAFKDRASGRLSGGMRQKLALACAVVASPPLLLLDEPSVGVDAVSRREIWQLTRELAGDQSGIVWTTNILDEAARCDSILLLHNGEVRYSGSTAGLERRATGRCFAAPLGSESRRDALQQVLERPDVITASIVGDSIRAVARATGLPASEGWQMEPPDAADGFAVTLDDNRVLPTSELAAAFPVRRSDPEAPPAIAAIGLTKRYGGFTAVNDISFTVRPGEIFGLLGPNGAGKSTTFRMLAGLIKPSAGQGAVVGRDLIRASAKARQAMGYMPQKFSLYADLTVAANLDFIAGAYGLSGQTKRAALDRVIDALTLEPYLRATSGLLPLGVKQRLSLATAVLHTPPVLFLDEPTSGVDPLVRREFWHHINAIAARGAAVLVTTHFMDEAENCDRLLLINQSEAIAQGSPADLKRDAIRGAQAETLEAAFIALIETQRRAMESEAA